MIKKRALVIVLVIVLAVIFVGMFCFYLGDYYALNHLSMRKTTPDQLTRAMQNDDYYSSFRENTVIFTGQVIGLSVKNNQTIVAIKTDTTYNLNCQINGLTQLEVGHTYRFLADAYLASREKSGLLLNDCLIN